MDITGIIDLRRRIAVAPEQSIDISIGGDRLQRCAAQIRGQRQRGVDRVRIILA